MPLHRVFRRGRNVLEEREIVAGDGGVELKLYPCVLQVLDALHGLVEGPHFAAKLVVLRRCGRVDGDGAALDARFLHLPGGFGRDERAVGRHDAAQPLALGVGDELVHVVTHHGLAAGEDDDGVAHVREGVDERLGLFRGELALVGFHVRLGPAVFAGEVAGAGHFPCHEAADRAAVLKRHLRFGLCPGVALAVRVSAGMAAGVPFGRAALVSVHIVIRSERAGRPR